MATVLLPHTDLPDDPTELAGAAEAMCHSGPSTAFGIYVPAAEAYVLIDPADRVRAHAALALGVPLRTEIVGGEQCNRRAWAVARDPRSERVHLRVEEVVSLGW